MSIAKAVVAERLGGEGTESDLIQEALEAIRRHLGMEMAYLSEFVDGHAVFRRVDAPGREDIIGVGRSFPLELTYCKRILEGRLPQLIADTSRHPAALSIEATHKIPIGSHISIPIRRPDGQPFGMFCCLSSKPNESLNERDLETMGMFADLVARQVNLEIEERRSLDDRQRKIREIIDRDEFSVVFQPIVDLSKMRTVGFESLCRVDMPPYRTPDVWFREAETVGLAEEFELAAIAKALKFFDSAPEDLWLSVNISPASVVSGGLARGLARAPFERLVLELTEHQPVEDYGALRDALAPLKAAGLRIAIDDAGAGYASFRHIIQLHPDIIKLDINLTRHVDTDPGRRALTTGIIAFARETGAELIAEGIETAKECRTLTAMGVDMGQGYLLGYPGELPADFDRPPGRMPNSGAAR